ncbi:MAG: response regulator transcription factor [Micrococcales bacterium]|uniref:response regulator transcription factor n=1 Tax=Phycicoccus sp. TaxID=1902410 RepID=UPI0019CC7031|nr:response regulator transcription factor [Phycicoccus sp.]MBD3781720.1 response regulator transcription factor [Micrococcales bacterium]HMM96640.1 response regulator transcription factor [Phycicoccus sp.]
MTIRVVVVDDHRIVREGLSALLGALDDTEVVGTAEDGRDAVHVVAEAAPDVVLMDIQMPHLDGIEATRMITGRQDVRVVMLTMNEDDETVLAAMRAGASGYLLKGSGAAEVQNAVRAAAAGGMVFGASLASRVSSYFAGMQPPTKPVATPFPELSDREREVLERLAAGKSNDAIAAELFVSNKTVRNAVSGIYAKLHAAGRAEAIVAAREAGFGRG